MVDELFQSTPPRRRRQEIGDIAFNLVDISIHASAKEATRLRTIWSPKLSEFQSTPPRRRRHLQTNKFPRLSRFQSTPPRRRRLSTGAFYYFEEKISIHASAKEATKKQYYTPDRLGISIHASAKEATLKKPDWW